MKPIERIKCANCNHQYKFHKRLTGHPDLGKYERDGCNMKGRFLTGCHCKGFVK